MVQASSAGAAAEVQATGNGSASAATQSQHPTGTGTPSQPAPSAQTAASPAAGVVNPELMPASPLPRKCGPPAESAPICTSR